MWRTEGQVVSPGVKKAGLHTAMKIIHKQRTREDRFYRKLIQPLGSIKYFIPVLLRFIAICHRKD